MSPMTSFIHSCHLCKGSAVPCYRSFSFSLHFILFLNSILSFFLFKFIFLLMSTPCLLSAFSFCSCFLSSANCVRVLRTVSPLYRDFTPPSVDEPPPPPAPSQCSHLPAHIHKRIFISSSPFPHKKIVIWLFHCCNIATSLLYICIEWKNDEYEGPSYSTTS